MNLAEAKEHLTPGDAAGIPHGKFEETQRMVDRGYKTFGKRYGWKMGKEKFNPSGDFPETDIEEYNHEKGFQ